MKIAIIGYGRMGRTIAALAPEMGHQVGTVIERAGNGDWSPERLAGCDVAIEFTLPEAAPDNILRCLDAGIPVVCGTTGWLHRYDEVAAAAVRLKGAFFYASNFSIGVNLCFALNRCLALWMDAHPEYDVQVVETHHKHKKDVPQIWGDPKDPVLNFRPQPPDPNGGLVECCGTGMGFNLWRVSMFRDERLRRPWFVTSNGVGGTGVGTQDLYFWGDARKYGYRCAIDCGVLVGHYDAQGDKVW